MNALPSIGGWVWGCSGNVCQVQKVQQHPTTKAVRLVVMCPQGKTVIPLDAVVGTAPDTTEHPAIGDRVWVAPVDAVGTVAQLDHEDRMARVNDIEGYTHPVTGYEVISQWFPYACLETIEEGRATE